MYSIGVPSTAVGKRSIEFLCDKPTNAIGPVTEATTPMRTGCCACTANGTKNANSVTESHAVHLSIVECKRRVKIGQVVCRLMMWPPTVNAYASHQTMRPRLFHCLGFQATAL